MKCYSYTVYVGIAKGCGRSWRNLWRAQYWAAYDEKGNWLGSHCCSKAAVNAVFSSDYARFVMRAYGPYTPSI